MSLIPPFFLDATVALGEPRASGQMHWVGTGFLVGRRSQNNPDKYTVYLITNKHVVRNKKYLHVRFNNNAHAGVNDLLMELFKDDGSPCFSEHPSPDADVVAIQIIPKVVTDEQLSLSFFQLDEHTQSLAQMQASGIDEGCLVYALGFPMNLVNDTVKAPICRLGCIARISDAFIKPKAGSYLVDVEVFPGNSGGPIINRPESLSIQGTPNNTGAFLIGILSGYLPYKDALISRQTGEMRMVQTENSGLTIVHPVDRIKEVVELEWERKQRQRQMKRAPNPPSPLFSKSGDNYDQN